MTFYFWMANMSFNKTKLFLEKDNGDDILITWRITTTTFKCNVGESMKCTKRNFIVP